MSSSRRILIIARSVGQDLLRRRVALTLLASLPAAFYLSVQGEELAPTEEPWTLTIGAIGIAWAVAGGAFFLALSSRSVDTRLLLAGISRRHLMTGRLSFLIAFASAISIGYSFFLVALSDASAVPLTLAVFSTALVAVFVGLLLAALLPQELEGTITLILVVGIQSSVPATSAIAPYLPFYGAMQLVRSAWFGGALLPWLLHVAGVSAALLAGAVAAWTRTSWFRPSNSDTPLRAPTLSD